MIEDLKLGRAYDGFLFLAESAKNPPVLRPHRHVELELNLVVRGTITYVVGRRRFTFGRGTLLWFFPTQVHQLVDRTSDAQYFVAVFKPSLIATACRGSNYAELKRQRVKGDEVLQATLHPPSFDLLRRTMDSLLEGAPDPEILNKEAGFGVGSDFSFRHKDPDRLNAGLRYLLLLAWQGQLAGREGSNAMSLHAAVRRALDFLGHDQTDWTLSDLARRCGVSGPYLSRLFCQQVGVPLNRYRNSTRLRCFWEHLSKPTCSSLAEAAFAAGFGSYAQFHRVFTEAYGQGPRALLNSRK